MGKGKGAAAFRSRIVGDSEESPDQLLANPLNWRVHPKEQVDALEGLLKQVGWVQRVIVNKRTGYVVDGHARVALALRRGEPTLPVVYVDLSEDEERLVLAAIDPIGGMAGTDDELLAQVLEGLEADEPGLQALLASLKNDAPNFEPGTEEDQSRLDQKNPTVCPSCGHEF
jgi:ParB-like chromosome segregation protein Spo0J